MLSSANILTPESIDEVSSSIRRTWYAARRIVAYELLDISQAIVNEWAELAVQTIKAWTPGLPYLALHDVSNPGVGMKYGWVHANLTHPAITQFGRARLFAAAEDEEQFYGRVAMLISLRQSGKLTGVVAARHKARTETVPNLQHKIVSDRARALQWLAEPLTS
ncbi:MAG: hypothetical protein HC876_01540 [Chloroflexaceae bacterium]|nr:hypothetical protein [Chloroflexaceae bacterium]